MQGVKIFSFTLLLIGLSTNVLAGVPNRDSQQSRPRLGDEFKQKLTDQQEKTVEKLLAVKYIFIDLPETVQSDVIPNIKEVITGSLFCDLECDCLRDDLVSYIEWMVCMINRQKKTQNVKLMEKVWLVMNKVRDTVRANNAPKEVKQKVEEAAIEVEALKQQSDVFKQRNSLSKTSIKRSSAVVCQLRSKATGEYMFASDPSPFGGAKRVHAGIGQAANDAGWWTFTEISNGKYNVENINPHGFLYAIEYPRDNQRRYTDLYLGSSITWCRDQCQWSIENLGGNYIKIKSKAFNEYLYLDYGYTQVGHWVHTRVSDSNLVSEDQLTWEKMNCYSQ